ncbi:hypothetical protein CKO09_00905 [Chromatium weissei]|nr:hypothetical protein [Chromatium weissei]
MFNKNASHSYSLPFGALQILYRHSIYSLTFQKTIASLFALTISALAADLFVDSWCQIPESNEESNQMTKKYTVK